MEHQGPARQQERTIEAIQAWLVERVAEELELDPHELNVETPLASYGFTSSAAVILAGDLEAWLGRELSETLLWEYPSIKALAQHLAGAQQPGERVLAPARAEPAGAEAIAIIGIGCRFPGAAGPDAFWQLLYAGREAISEVPPERWDSEAFYDPSPDAPGKIYMRRAGFLADIGSFDAHFFGISPREALRMEPQQRLLLEVAWEALEHAGQTRDKLAGSRTGVFVGLMSSHQYTQRQLRFDPTCIDDPYFALGSAASIAAGRLAYCFDLHGPTMVVDTACSSSLVALHLACQSLRAHECGMALVGGANEITLAENVANACKMRMLSADGRCKTFDADADGFGIGEGCGVVVLKRLSAALADRDNIHAVIRGSAVNQDGQSNGITAPNKLAQQAVIREALANAAVAPQQVSYVEAHGSGTALGDPIEVEAIAAVLDAGRPQDQRLLIGAVKTNIGHLAAAAGIAGLIKTVLALQHKAIPPHLNVQRRNPKIAWDTSAIDIPTSLTPWPAEHGPRIAGVNSFGWSGTNAHVVLEEAPAGTTCGPARPWQLLALSAQSQAALEAATTNLLAYIQQRPQADLADIAYTYQVGRNAFSHRRTLVCRDRADALLALEGQDPQRILTGTCPSSRRPVLFLFPGLGDHYVHMAERLYQVEPVFRTTVDRCCQLLEPHLGLDIRPVVYPGKRAAAPTEEPSAPARLDLRTLLGRGEQQAGAAQQLDRTLLAQPALFVIEYALAQLWLSWGVRPQAMLGYSLGEYLAACLAGVFSLEAALMLVAQRARMIQELPAGAMLAVALPEQDIHALLGPELSLSAVNGAMLCVVAGPTAAIEACERQLTDGGVACRRLQASHAFHSALMEPLMGPFTEFVSTIDLKPPQIPYVSNVTGTWITAEQATDPRYWARHLRQTVRFAEGLATLWQASDGILLEIGPGQLLGSLALQYAARTNITDPVVLPSLPHAADRQPDDAFILRTLGQLWLSGAALDWPAFYAHEQRQLLAVPTYPFERQRYWVDIVDAADGRQATRARPGTGTKTADMADWFYVPVWKQSPPLLAVPAAAQGEQLLHCLIFADAYTVGTQLAERLQERGQDVTVVVFGDRFSRLRDGVYTIDPRAADDYQALLKHLSMVDKAPGQIVHLWSLIRSDHIEVNGEALELALELGFYSLLFLAQAVGNQSLSNQLRLLVVSNGLHDVIGGEHLRPEKATLLGPCKVIPKEYPNISCRSIDITLPEPDARSVEQIVEQLILELNARSSEELIAYRGGNRWLRSYEPLRLEDAPESATRLREHGVYLITGGLGGLGLALAGYLFRAVRARLVLVGRAALPPREQWDQWLADHDPQDQASRKIAAVQALETAGAQLLVASADVADLEQMQAVIARAEERFGAVHGVFHAAGVPGEGIIQLKKPASAAQVLAPKVQGTLVLASALQHTALDFMVFYSSSTAITGGLGEVDYCAANAFLDAYARYNSAQRHVPSTSINWGPWQWDAWQSTLFAAAPEIYAQIQQIRTAYGITMDEGERALRRILAYSLPQVLALTQDLQATLAQSERLASFGSLEQMHQGQHARSAYARPNLRNDYVAPRNEAEQKIAAIWQEFLGIEQVGIYDRFFELGGNSLIGMFIVSRLQQEFDVQLSVASLFEAPTVSSLLELIYAGRHEQPGLEQNSSRGQKRRERLKRHKQTA